MKKGLLLALFSASLLSLAPSQGARLFQIGSDNAAAQPTRPLPVIGEICDVSSTGLTTCPGGSTASLAGSSVIVVPDDFPDIQSAIDAAAHGDTISVEPGNYPGSLDYLGKRLTIESTGGAAVTRILGDGGTAVRIGPDGTLTGFTVSLGANSFGAGMSVHDGGNKILDNIFEDNFQFAGGFGAAIAGNDADALIQGNLFRFNSCDGQFLSGVVSFVNGSHVDLVNNVFVDNTCRAINMVLPEGARVRVVNNTIVANPTGIKASVFSPDTQLYFNNIVFDNGIGLESSGAPVWEHNLVFGNDVNYSGMADPTGIDGNLSADPLFVDADARDFHLLEGSPAIDAGDSFAQGLPEIDFEGDDRILDGDGDGGADVDIGADESPAQVTDTVPPSVTCQLISLGSCSGADDEQGDEAEDDEAAEGAGSALFVVDVQASDARGPVEFSSVLVLEDSAGEACGSLPLTASPVVSLACDGTCSGGQEGPVVTARAAAVRLLVTARDEAGNEATCEAEASCGGAASGGGAGIEASSGRPQPPGSGSRATPSLRR